jgi:D-alanyl-lipoteichoic acid acyltransferase DltB (MBOAT superfamily)
VRSEFAQLYRYLPLLITFLLFPAAAWVALRFTRGAGRARALALLNLMALPALCMAATGGVRRLYLIDFAMEAILWVAGYVALASMSYLLVRRFGQDSSWRFWAAFAFPIAMLVVVRYMLGDSLRLPGGPLPSSLFLGISYLAFRLSHLSIEVRNRVVEMPALEEYLAYAFFPPTLSVGPISPYSLFQQSLNHPNPSVTPPLRSLLRVLVGLTKYQFLSSLVNQLSYQGLLLDGHPHGWIDLPVAMVAYYVYLYLNFSGWCDMAIGAAGLMGLRVAENFDRPFSARNVQEYWSRWHITLSSYMRDVVFSPLSKSLVRLMGVKNSNHAIAISIMVVFLMMGLWHGIAWHYLIYDLLQGIGVVTAHYYTAWLKKRLGRDGYARYMATSWIRVVAIAVTFIYACASLFFFANPISLLPRILAVLH